MSGTGVPPSNTSPGAEQNSFHQSGPRNHFQTNNIANHGSVMHGNFSQMDAARSTQNPYGMDNRALKTATQPSQALPSEYCLCRTQRFRHQSNII